MEFKYQYVRYCLVGIIVLHFAIALWWVKYHTIEMSKNDVSFEAEGQTELMRAVIEGKSLGDIERIIDASDEVSYKTIKDSQGNTALMYALYKRSSIEVIDTLKDAKGYRNNAGLFPSDLILYSRWKNAAGAETRLYVDDEIQVELDAWYDGDDVDIGLFIASIVMWVLSFFVAWVGSLSHLPPAKKVFLCILELLLYIPVLSAIVYYFAWQNPMLTIESIWNYLCYSIEYGIVTGIAMIPGMFYYHYDIPDNRWENMDERSRAYMLIIFLPYYSIKYFVLLMIRGDTIKVNNGDSDTSG